MKRLADQHTNALKQKEATLWHQIETKISEKEKEVEISMERVKKIEVSDTLMDLANTNIIEVAHSSYITDAN